MTADHFIPGQYVDGTGTTIGKGFAGSMIGVIICASVWLVGRTGFVIAPLRTAGVMTIPELFG